MKRMIIQDKTTIQPFGEPARELRILNKPLWLRQRDILSPYCKGAKEIQSLHDLPETAEEELLVHKDNLFFNEQLIETFITQARASGKPCQIAFRKNDRAIKTHALPLQEHIRLQEYPPREGEQGKKVSYYVADLYYYPPGPLAPPQPLVIETEAREMGYYSVPRYMAKQGDLVFQIPLRAFLSIEHWVHLFLANITMGLFAQASQAEYEMDRCSIRRITKWNAQDWKYFGKKMKLVLTAFLERINPFEEKWRNHFLSSKSLVKVGKNCSIDPTAIIHGPTTIGDNVYIGPGVVIANSLIGSNVNIMQGSQVMLSVVSDRTFLAFNAAIFMSSLMENCMLAQNTCVQLGVVGRNTFLGANSVFTDFNLSDDPKKQLIRTMNNKGELVSSGLPVLGSAVGHNCKIGSGFVVYPGRTIGSNVTIVYNDREGLISKNVPGASPEDIDQETGEPRRVFYRWPDLFEEEDEKEQKESATQDDTNHRQENENTNQNKRSPEQHRPTRPAPIREWENTLPNHDHKGVRNHHSEPRV
jgi:acetyltransferase-like isoleucine patch superfamily enzyme